MRGLFTFALAVLLGGALFFGLTRVRGLTEPDGPAAPAPAEAPATEREAPRRAAPVPAPAAKSPAPAPEPERPPVAPRPTELAGSVVVLDESGGALTQENGVLSLALGPAGARTLREVEVRGGRWSLALGGERAGDGPLVLRAAVLGQRPAVPAADAPAEFALPADGRIDLRLQRSGGARLSVRARDGGRELEAVTLLELPLAQHGSSRDTLHPGLEASAQARQAGPSPVTLDSADFDGLDARVLWAKAAGHAWGRIELDPRAGTAPVLLLDPAGTLELACAGAAADAELEIRLLAATPPHAEVLVVARGAQPTLVLEDLRPGRYRAEARRSGLLAGAAEIEIAAGQRTQAVLEAATPATEPVPFEGVLVVPATWQLDDFILEFLLQGPFDGASLTRGSFELRRSEMTLEPGSTERFRWKAPAARAARYRVALHPAPFATELDTGPAGTREALITVPPPCLVSVRAFDALAELGAPLAWSDKLAFAALTPRATALQPTPVLAGASAAPRELRVPQGRVLFLTTSTQHAPTARLVELGPGTNELLLPLRKKP